MDERQFGGQRKEKRVSINKEFAGVGAFVREYVSNISTSGAFIVTEEPLPKGTRVDLKFSIITDRIETIEGEGEVVRVVRPGPGRKGGMGVVFTRLTSCSKGLIEELVTRKPKRKPVILG
jgi:uncharacterized protein (TIGR02266 family)